MSRRVLGPALLLSLLLSLLLPTTVGAVDPPLPDSMAAVGDSITQAASTGGTLGADAPQNSWSTGTSTTVNSHYLRLIGAGASISGQNHNRSVSGAKMGDLDGQMATVVALQPDYVTVLIGGNDLCTDTVAEMTSVEVFRSQFEAAMDRVMTGTTTTLTYVVSIPDVYQLWNLFKGNLLARLVWASAGICQSLLANPTSTQQADVDRRAAVRQRNIDYNTQLAQVCALHARCRFDNNAVFNTAFTTSDVSGDYFHPSVAGQAKLASVTWDAGYTWASAAPTPMWVGGLASSASSARNSWTATVTIAVHDASGALSGVAVAGSWTAGSGSGSCTTGASGTCTVSVSLNKKTTSTTYTVTGLTKAGWVYQSSSNAATSIRVTKP